MKKIVSAMFGYIVLAFVATSCMVVDQEAVTTSTAADGTVTEFRSRSRIRAIGDGRNSVDKVRASAGKTASVGASGVEQEASATNAAAIAGEILGTAIRTAAKP